VRVILRMFLGTFSMSLGIFCFGGRGIFFIKQLSWHVLKYVAGLHEEMTLDISNMDKKLWKTDALMQRRGGIPVLTHLTLTYLCNIMS